MDKSRALPVKTRVYEKDLHYLFDAVNNLLDNMGSGAPYVMVTKARLSDLEDSQGMLEALQMFGVDNWEGYDEATRSHLGGTL